MRRIPTNHISAFFRDGDGCWVGPAAARNSCTGAGQFTAGRSVRPRLADPINIWDHRTLVITDAASVDQRWADGGVRCVGWLSLLGYALPGRDRFYHVALYRYACIR